MSLFKTRAALRRRHAVVGSSLGGFSWGVKGGWGGIDGGRWRRTMGDSFFRDYWIENRVG